MITSELQYQLTKQWAKRFEEDATALEASYLPEGVPAEIRKSQIEAARSEAKILREQMAEYDAKRR